MQPRRASLPFRMRAGRRARPGTWQPSRRTPSADAALLGLERVREPRVPRPRPPERGEDEDSTTGTSPAQLRGDELGDLRHGKDDDEIEEQLQRGDALFALDLSIDHGYGASARDAKANTTRLLQVRHRAACRQAGRIGFGQRATPSRIVIL
jgi:hypothetical protein